MRKIGFVLTTVILCFSFLISGCAPSYRAHIISVKKVDVVVVNGVGYRMEGKDNIQIVLDFYFDKKFSSDLEGKSGDDYKNLLFDKLAEGAHLFYRGQEIERLYGYWPKEAGENYAKKMSLFYAVPKNCPAGSLKFVYDGSLLGEKALGIDTLVNPRN